MYKKLIKEYKFILSKMLSESMPEPPEPPEPPPPDVNGPGDPWDVDINQLSWNFDPSATPLDNSEEGVIWSIQQFDKEKRSLATRIGGPNQLFIQMLEAAERARWRQYVKDRWQSHGEDWNHDAFDHYTVDVEDPSQIINPETGQPVQLPPGYEWVQIGNNPPRWGIINNNTNPPSRLLVKDLFGYGRSANKNDAVRLMFGGDINRRYPSGWPILPRRVTYLGPGALNYTWGTNLTDSQLGLVLSQYHVTWTGPDGQPHNIILNDPKTFPPDFTFDDWLHLFSDSLKSLFGNFAYVHVSENGEAVGVNDVQNARNHNGSRAPIGFAGFEWDPGPPPRFFIPQHSSKPGSYQDFMDHIFNILGGNAPGRPGLNNIPIKFWGGNYDPSSPLPPWMQWLIWFTNIGKDGKGNNINGVFAHNLGGYHITTYRGPRRPTLGQDVPGQLPLFPDIPTTPVRPRPRIP